jgi:small subunit ribosomal protein S4
MGDPRKQRRKDERPPHLWKAARMLEESELCKKYGLKSMTELWKAKTKVKRIREQARKLLGKSDEKAQAETKELLAKLSRLGIIDAKTIEEVLALKVENLLDRRLQTMVFRKNLAATLKQARQLVIHDHVIIGNNVVSIPSYMVPRDEEDKIKVDERIIKVMTKSGEGKQGEKAAVPEEGKAAA